MWFYDVQKKSSQLPTHYKTAKLVDKWLWQKTCWLLRMYVISYGIQNAALIG